MAPRLACVCTAWAAAVAETPELWRVLDTQYLTSGGSSSCNAAPTAGKKRKGSRNSSTRSSRRQESSIDAGITEWVEAGRLQELRDLRLCCAGSSHLSLEDPLFFEDAEAAQGVGSAAGAAVGRAAGAGGGELGGTALLLLAQECRQLRRVSISGAPAFRAEVSSAGATQLARQIACCLDRGKGY